MAEPLVIIHERVASWSRQLRPRFRGASVRWKESRSAESLARAAAEVSNPILVVDLTHRPVRALEDLAGAIEASPTALALVLDPEDRPETAWIARELGAALVLGGTVVPPQVESLLNRWLAVARGRSQAGGWSSGSAADPDRDDRAGFAPG